MGYKSSIRDTAPPVASDTNEAFLGRRDLWRHALHTVVAERPCAFANEFIVWPLLFINVSICMVRIFSQVKGKVKNIFPLMETIAFIKKEMDRRGWNKARLVAESGISSRAATCFFQDGKVNSENTFRILKALDLFSIDQTARSGTIKPYQSVLDLADAILARGDEDSRNNLTYAITRLHQAMTAGKPSSEDQDIPLIENG